MASLPQELLDIIVDELSQDRESLHALHSTSRSFRHRAQSHLFRSIHLPEKRSCHSFLELCTASPNILDLVQTLEVTVFIDRDAYQALGNHSLPNLRSLRIDGGPSILPGRHLSRVNMHEIPSSLLTYPITNLTLDGLNIDSARDMRNILRSFPTLQTLVMNQVRVCHVTEPLGSISEAGETEPDDGPVIEDLSISFTSYNLCDMNALLEIKGRPFVLRGLRKLSCTWVQYWHGIRDIQLLLHATKRTLQELHLCHSDVTYWGIYQMSHILDFSHVPCVTFEAPRRNTDQIIGLNWFTECLEYQEDGPTRISQLHLSLRIPNFETLLSDYRIVWRSLDRALAVERFASLEKFNISVVIDSPMAATGEQNEDQLGLPQMEQAIFSAFPALHEQRKVFVQIVGP
ncbi:hypothetical protein ARMSODRAFT_328856 [Armillaria solidipes]|uniref:F-box domain-containing protein n=1 Tax=Armillaria solidipes TaxID=1076256 RepID=A0A2H3BSL6_9AGAR|nr:hypothetical protein ARMSODRAFT_328856 [Armillaria solidipes]